MSCVFYGVRYYKGAKGREAIHFGTRKGKTVALGRIKLSPCGLVLTLFPNSARDDSRRPFYQPVSSSTYRCSS